MRILRSLALGSFIVLASASGRSQPVTNGTVVATVQGDFEVTVANLMTRSERIFYRGVLDRPERYRIALREATLEHLMGLDFFRLGYDQDPAFTASLGPKLAEELLLAYYDRKYEDAYLNEDAIRAQHEAMGRVVAYRQIVLRKPAGASPPGLDGLRATVAEIRQQLDEGVSAETLVQRYSQDEASVSTGGLMPPVTWEESTRSPLNAVAFRLDPGEAVSVETQDAFVVAVGERLGERPLPPLAVVSGQIVEVLRGRYAEQANQAYYQERQALVDSASVRWNDEVLDQIVRWSRTPGFFEGDYSNAVQGFLAANGDDLVFSDSAGELRLGDLPRLLSEILTVSGASRTHSKAFVQDFLLEAVRADRMVDLALELGLRDELMRPSTPSPVLANAFARFYRQKHIESQIPDTTETALRAFYEAHADSLFYQLATVYTEAAVRETEAEIDEVWAQVQEGVPFDEASSRRLIRSFERTRDGEIVSRLNGEPPYWGQIAFGLDVGEMVGPFVYDPPEGRHYAILRVTKRLDERQLPFEEVRERVVEAFRDHHRARLEAEVDAELRRRYAVDTNERVMAALLRASD